MHALKLENSDKAKLNESGNRNCIHIYFNLITLLRVVIELLDDPRNIRIIDF